MVNKEDIRKYFSRYFLGRIPVHSVSIFENEVIIKKLSRNIKVHGKTVNARIVSPLQFACGKLACVSSGMMMHNMLAKVYGDRIKKYASGEIKVKKISLRIAKKIHRWHKEFSMLPQERRNSLSYIPKKERIVNINELNLAYFQPIIHDIVIKLVLNKQNGSLLVWYNSISRNSNPKGLYMYKRFGEKDIDWRWVETTSQSKN